MRGMNRLKSGDILFFATKPEKRKVGEIIGHMGIIKVKKTDRNLKGGGIFLIHASGIKERGGTVKKILLREYLSRMGFLGVKITRFE